MPKLHSTMPDDPPSRRRSWVRTVLTILLGLALAPLVREGALLCNANWRGMKGEATSVQTPVLDALGATWSQTSKSIQATVGGFFINRPWRPEYVIGVSLVWAIGGGYLLRSAWH
ncbi:MAG: hypothetical protein ABI353_15725 [Isosphaeraceae bacterium]